jgi:hypothetical protein
MFQIRLSNEFLGKKEWKTNDKYLFFITINHKNSIQ